MWKYFTHDIAIDLGTANTLVALRGEGIVINEPSVVAVNKATKRVLAVGNEAKQMLGRAPANVSAHRPLQDGAISDFDSTEVMLRYFIGKVHNMYPKLIHLNMPRVIIGVPTTITEVEMNAVVDASKLAGARKVYIVQEPLAVAIAAKASAVRQASGGMVVDIGGGTTDIAVFSMGGIVVDRTVKVAGDEMNREIIEYARNKYNILIGENMAEEVKVAIGTISNTKDNRSVEIRGRDILSGLPKSLKISSAEVREALTKVLDEIILAVKEALEHTPPELLADIMETGLTLAGGGALITGIDKYFGDSLHIPVKIVDNPLHGVINGLSLLFADFPLLEKVQIKDSHFI
jgi:rod shape-determining protein MreB